MRAWSRFLLVLLICTVPAVQIVYAADGDGDGIDDAVDNCPVEPNPEQGDLDADGIGDVCDPETLVATDLTLTVTPTYFQDLRIATGASLTANSLVEVMGDMTIESGALVTHSPYAGGTVPEVNLFVLGLLDVQGSIDVSERGLRGGEGRTGIGGRGGEAYDCSTGSCIIGEHPRWWGGTGQGGSHGGTGGAGSNANSVAPSPYGWLEQPVWHGSGGGAGCTSGTCNPGPTTPQGGNGGGRVRIFAAIVTVDGAILANGGNGISNGGKSGGGSGGSIYLESASWFSGSGTILANGGDGVSGSGAGGGGRIHLEYGSQGLPQPTRLARSGQTGNTGAAGTILLEDRPEFPDLILDHGGVVNSHSTPLLTLLGTLRSITVVGPQSFIVTSAEVTALTVQQPLVLENGVTTLIDGVLLQVTNPTGFDFQVQSGAALTFAAGTVLDADTLQIDGGAVETGVDLSFTGATDLELGGSGTLSVLGGATLSVPSFESTTFQSGTLTIHDGARLDVSSDTATIGNGMTLVKDGSFGPNDQITTLTIESGGVVSHSLRHLAGVVLKLTGLLEIETGGAIDVSAKGCRGARRDGTALGEFGETPAGAGNCVAGSGQEAGGSYGGWGGWRFDNSIDAPNPPYGQLEWPAFPGSGGGGGASSGQGGHGGGLVSIQAPDVIVDGAIRADGETYNPGGGSGGPGSGGGILIDVQGALSGVGTITANGGPAALRNNGGGGRIAIHYGTLAIPMGNVTAARGNYTDPAAWSLHATSGTVYFKDKAETFGDLVLDNSLDPGTQSTPLLTALSGFRSIQLRSAGRLSVDSSIVPHLFVDDLVIDGADSMLTHASRDLDGLRLSVIDTLDLSNGGKIAANGKGLLGGGVSGNGFGQTGEAYEVLGLIVAPGSTAGSGGSYGGHGGGPSPNLTYGDPQNPSHAGSGGSTSAASGLGGNGGGRLWIDADTCHVPVGTSIEANGGASTSGSGAQAGGSGGSILLECAEMDGSGTLSADGGGGSGTAGNGGGGGRIARRIGIDSFSGVARATGGDGNSVGGLDGEDGTVFATTSSYGQMTVDSISPAKGSNRGSVTIEISGLSFDPSADVRLLRAGETDLVAQSVTEVTPGTRLSATIDLTGSVTGLWDLAVTNPNGERAVGVALFEVNDGGLGRLHLDVKGPSFVRPLRDYVVLVEYGNKGLTDIPAPLIEVSDNQGVFMRMSAAEAYAPGPIQFVGLGPDNSVDVLPPGSSFTVPVHIFAPALPGHTLIRFDAEEKIGDATLIDWAVVEAAVRPAGMGAGAWQALLSNLQTQIGTTTADYVNALVGDAVGLTGRGNRTISVGRLLRFELLQAGGAIASTPVLASAVDAAIPTNGLPLLFTRTATIPIEQRRRLGPLGRGWSHNYEISLRVESAEEIIIEGPGPIRRRFSNHDGRGWDGEPGEAGELTGNGIGGYDLVDKHGIVSTFDASGNLTILSEPGGWSLTLIYNAGRLEQITHSDGQSLTLTYNASNRIDGLSDLLGRTVSYGYTIDNLTSVTKPGPVVTTYDYEPAIGGPADHALNEIGWPDGTTHTFYEFDAEGRLSATYRDGNAARLDYSYVGGAAEVLDANGNSLTLFKGSAGELLEVENALGETTRYRRDGHARISEIITPSGATAKLSYDAAGNPRQATDPLGRSTLMGHTPEHGRLDWIRDPNGNLTDYTVNPAGNVTVVEHADTTMETTIYVGGLAQTRTNRRSQAVGLGYDADNRLQTISQPGGRSVTIGYDPHWNVDTIADSQTGTVTMLYNTRDQLERIDFPDGKWFTFTYDDVGRRTGRVGHDGFVLSYGYDPVGRLESVSSGGTEFVHYTYDPAGRLDRKDLDNGTYTTYQYDDAGQLTALFNHAPGGAVQSSFGYTYDMSGRRDTMTTSAGITSYEYDDLDQLTRVDYPNARAVTYDYDAAGNRIAVDDNGTVANYVTNEMNQYDTAGVTTFVYDDDGNMVSRTDGSGTTTYQYDVFGRLTGVNSPTEGAFTFTYDGLGNRTEVDHDGVVTRYVHDPIGPINVAAEYDSLGTLVARYIHSLLGESASDLAGESASDLAGESASDLAGESASDFGSSLVARLDSSGNPFYYGYDALGSTSQVTDAAGTIVNSHDYEAFGETTASAPPQDPYGYLASAGVHSDPSGLQYMHARYYDPRLGRFLSEDPLGIAGGVNLYRYAGNTPTNLSDPSGLRPDVSPGAWSGPCGAGSRTAVIGIPGAPATGASRLISGHLACRSDPGPSFGGLEVRDEPVALPSLDSAHETVEVITSGDPNEKLGPDGYDPGGLPTNPHFIRGDEPFSYTIYFENVPTASAAAQEVFVTDVLDAALDAASVVLGEIAFGEYVVSDLIGQSTGTVTVPLKNSTYQVDVTVDNAGGVLTWTLRMIDPMTGQLPTDALAGFLPPNDAAGNGEGRVSFSVQPVNGVSSGTAISNSASIVFDTNALIVTDAWINTIDNLAPTTSVDSIALLPGGAPNDRLVSWSGGDDAAGAGLDSYTVYVSEDAGPYAAWLTGTQTTSAGLPVQCNRTYRFYSLAGDHVGNLETVPGGGADLTYQAGPDLDFDTVCDDLDNCGGLPNVSQADSDGDGIGDACDGNPVFFVSSDPADGPDFATIQEAVDAAPQSGTTIHILTGIGYTGTVIADTNESLSFVGGPGATVVVDGGTGAAFDLRSAGSTSMIFRNLTITGQDGILSTVPVELRGVQFDQIPGTALRTSSAADLVNVIIGASGNGIRIDTGGSLQMEYATIAGNTGIGVDNPGLGTVTIATSIVHGNTGGDLSSVTCDVVSFSDVAVPDCSAQNGNIALPPALLADFHLDATSPCLDAGPDPALYSGEPIGDFGGDLRLRDYDGDGLAQSDMGAFEELNPSLVPGEIAGLSWTDDTHLNWNADAQAVEYHLYRGTLPGSYTTFGDCHDAADAVRTDTAFIEPDTPALGQVWSYLVTAEDSSGNEGTLGFAAGAERSNFAICP